MKYTENDIKVGTKIICKDNDSCAWWKKDKVYEIVESKFSKEIICVIDEEGSERYSRGIIDRLNGDSRVKFELFKEENNMNDIKVGDLVEVIKNSSGAYKGKSERFKAGDKAIVSEVIGFNVRIYDEVIGDRCYGNLIGKSEIKKVETTPELTEYEEELVLILADYIQHKNTCLSQIKKFKNNIKFNENELEKVSKEIKEISKKLLTK